MANDSNHDLLDSLYTEFEKKQNNQNKISRREAIILTAKILSTVGFSVLATKKGVEVFEIVLRQMDEMLPLKPLSSIESSNERYLRNGIPINIGISPLTLLFKVDFKHLINDDNSFLFRINTEESRVLEEISNFSELRGILSISNPRLRLQKIIEYLSVSTKEDANGNKRYSSNVIDGACNGYITDIFDLLFYNRLDDLLSYRTDLNGNPIIDPVEILKIDQGIRTDGFMFRNANSLLQLSEQQVNQGKMIDATNFTYEEHLDYLKNGYAFVVFLVNSVDTPKNGPAGTATHVLLEYSIDDKNGNLIPVRTQATRNILAERVTPSNVIFKGDESKEFKRRYPRVFAFKIPEL